MSEQPPDSWRQTIRRRVAVTAAVLALWSLTIAGRLVDLQVVEHEELKRLAEKRTTREIEITPKRGAIVDRNGRPVAYTAELPSIYANLAKAADAAKHAEALCEALDCSSKERQRLRTELSTRKGRVVVERGVNPSAAIRVRDLNLEWIEFEFERQRFYPYRELAAHVIGKLGKQGPDQMALGGIESGYDGRLKGIVGKVIQQVDARGEPFIIRTAKPPTPGADVELSIDILVQEMVERELRAAVVENHAEGGSVVVMDTPSGEVLAMAHSPTFNPNGPAPRDGVRNPVVEDAFEAGSAMKTFTAAAALEEQVVKPEDVIDTSPGRIVLGPDDVVTDGEHDYGRLLFTDVIAKSSNVGTIKVARMLGVERLIRYLRLFGFGTRISGEFGRSEALGILKDPSRLTGEGEFEHVAIGYNVAVTPLQLAAAMSSIANGGELVQPRVVRAAIQDHVRHEYPRRVLNRTVTPEVAATMRSILEKVVDSGTGQAARIPGYTVAGKTGTARKLTSEGYSTTEYSSTFVGFVSSGSPLFTIVVVIDSPKGPKGYFGGPVAGAVFKRIAENMLRLAAVPPVVNPPVPLLVSREPEGLRERPASGPATPPAALVAIDRRPGADGRLPDVTGMSAREALRTLSQAGVKAHARGSGLVIDQRPEPGTTFDADTTVTFWLGRPPATQTANHTGQP